MQKTLVTSALPYANGDLHIGHLVEYIQTDIYVRFLRLTGTDVIYMCASDAHGTPIEINAKKRGITPEELVGYYHKRQAEDFARFEIDFDEYYTTDSPENQKHSEAIYQHAKEKGYIDVKDVEQFYCEECNRFLPDRFIKGACPKCDTEDQYGDVCESCGATYQPTELKNARCAICGASPSLHTSKHFFFKLSDPRIKKFLSQWTAQPGRLQPEVLAFVRSWIDQGLQDWDISRDGPYFGFKIPGEKDKYFYVWLDAPVGYIAATEHYCAKHDNRNIEDYWLKPKAKTEIHHFIGKDIAYFHTLFWPAMLKVADYITPTSVHVHGFLTVNGRKMSKSRGTFITARLYADYLSTWYLRYYYATKLSGSIDDLDLNIEEFVNRNNAELVNNITNLISRTIGFLNKRLDSKLGTIPSDVKELIPQIEDSIERAREHYSSLLYSQAVKEMLAIADIANNYIQQAEPWAAIKSDPDRARDILTFACNCIKVITVLLKPILPAYCRQVETMLGLSDLKWEDTTFDLQNCKVGTFEKLVDRLEPNAFEKLVEASQANLAPAETETQPVVPEFAEEITIDDFFRVDLRAAKILSAEHVKGADKLVKLQVDLGREKRMIIAGIKKHYAAEDLVGRTVVVVANLKPRKMKFGTSEGMVLAAVDEPGNALTLLDVDSSIPPGSPIR